MKTTCIGSHIGAVLAVMIATSILIKAGLIAYLDGRVYADVLRSLNFGLGLQDGLISITTHVDNTKSFLGPVLNAAVYRVGGVMAIKGLNLLLFIGLCLTMFQIGRDRYTPPVVVVACFLLAFYAGGHRNVVAGEIEDNLASLLFAVGLLAYVKPRRAFQAALLMGVAFLVKFWIAIFVAAFGVFLLTQRRWRDLVGAAAGSLLPVAMLSLLDHGATLRSLMMTIDRQQGLSTWSLVAVRMFTTGLLPTVALATWTLVKRPSDHGTLFFGFLASYFAYVLLFRDAHAVTFVMMLCLVPGGFLLAEFLVHGPLVGGARVGGRARIVVVLTVFAVGNLGVAWQHLHRDTQPFTINPGQDAMPLGSAGSYETDPSTTSPVERHAA